MTAHPIVAVLDRHPALTSPQVIDALAERLEADLIRIENEVEARLEAMRTNVTMEALRVFVASTPLTEPRPVKEPLTQPQQPKPLTEPRPVKAPLPQPTPKPRLSATSQDRTLRWTIRRQKSAAQAFETLAGHSVTGTNAELRDLIGVAQTAEPVAAQQAMLAARDLVQSMAQPDPGLAAVIRAWGGEFKRAANTTPAQNVHWLAGDRRSRSPA